MSSDSDKMQLKNLNSQNPKGTHNLEYIIRMPIITWNSVILINFKRFTTHPDIF